MAPFASHAYRIGIDQKMKSSKSVAVVVHHRSYTTIVETINRIIDEGVITSSILVVDNSEEGHRKEELISSLPQDINIVFTPNKGYGAAVNLGVDWHSRNTKYTEFLIVSTHEARPEPGAILCLEAAMSREPSAAVVGPALVTGENSEIIWSLGGYQSKFLAIPRHYGIQDTRSKLVNARDRRVSWLDGAFLMFRRSVIERHQLDEAFFLYMEEVDHQLSLQRAGWDVFLEPKAVVWQSSSGIPAYYQSRNIQLLHSKNGTSAQRWLAAPYLIARTIARDALRRRGTSDWGKLLSGWRDGIRLKARSVTNFSPRVVVVNPLGGALAHYTEALKMTLRESGARVAVHSTDEPSISGRNRWLWMLDYLRLLQTAVRDRGSEEKPQILVTWPTIGFLDLLVVGLICGKRSTIIYHDPKPLVRSIGSGRVIANLIRKFPRLPRIIVHSEVAADTMRDLGFNSHLEILAHPMIRPSMQKYIENSRDNANPKVRVLGQFKKDRDLDVLVFLANTLPEKCELEIVGRGWPQIEGWDVDSRFVSEEELDGLIKSSDAIVIPYKRFYQSGIAIRALEFGTPIVGRSDTSLADLYGSKSDLLVTESTDESRNKELWNSAVLHAISHGRKEATRAGEIFCGKAVTDWKRWISRPPSFERRA